MNSKIRFFIKSAQVCAGYLSRIGLTRFLEIIGRLDPVLGVSGVSVMLADGMYTAGKIDQARHLIERNIADTLDPVTKKKLKHIKKERVPAAIPLETKLKHMDQVLAALRPSGARFFLTFGTLLGLVRERGFMDHDRDLDLGVFTTEASSMEVKRLLAQEGLKILKYEGPEWPCRIKTAAPDNFTADIMFFKPEEDCLLTYIRFLNQIIIRERKVFDLVETEFYGRKVWIPENPENFLEENYRQWTKRSGYHHPILMSRLTDFNLPIIKYLCTRTFFLLLAKQSTEEASCLLEIITENYPGDLFWSRQKTLFMRLLA